MPIFNISFWQVLKGRKLHFKHAWTDVNASVCRIGNKVPKVWTLLRNTNGIAKRLLLICNMNETSRPSSLDETTTLSVSQTDRQTNHIRFSAPVMEMEKCCFKFAYKLMLFQWKWNVRLSVCPSVSRHLYVLNPQSIAIGGNRRWKTTTNSRHKDIHGFIHMSTKCWTIKTRSKS